MVIRFGITHGCMSIRFKRHYTWMHVDCSDSEFLSLPCNLIWCGRTYKVWDIRWHPTRKTWVSIYKAS